MTMLGHLTIAWTWLWQAVVAQWALGARRGEVLQEGAVEQHASPNAPEGDADFYRGKLQACRFFFATELPVIEHAARLVRDADSTAFDMRAEWF